MIGHEFIVVDNVTGDILYTYEITCHSFFVIGEIGTQTRLRDDAQQKIQDTLHAEWFRHKNVKRTFTELGFAKGQLPLDLFASMQTYYYNNRQHKLREEWDAKGGSNRDLTLTVSLSATLILILALFLCISLIILPFPNHPYLSHPYS